LFKGFSAWKSINTILTLLQHVGNTAQSASNSSDENAQQEMTCLLIAMGAYVGLLTLPYMAKKLSSVTQDNLPSISETFNKVGKEAAFLSSLTSTWGFVFDGLAKAAGVPLNMQDANITLSHLKDMANLPAAATSVANNPLVKNGFYTALQAIMGSVTTGVIPSSGTDLESVKFIAPTTEEEIDYALLVFATNLQEQIGLLEEDEYAARNTVMAEEGDDFAKLQQCNDILQKLHQYKQQSEKSSDPKVSEIVKDVESMVKELLGEEIKITDSKKIVEQIQQRFDELAGSARILTFDKLFFDKRSKPDKTTDKSVPKPEDRKSRVDEESLTEQGMLDKFSEHFTSLEQQKEIDSSYIASQYEEFRKECENHQQLLSLMAAEEKDRKSIKDQEESVKQKLVENFNKNMKGLIMQFAVKLQMHEMKR
jgi:hypothetical protein